MDNTVTTIIDPEKCTGCGLCVKVCPSETLSMLDGKAVVSGDRSIQCGQCEAVCPEGAVHVKALDNSALDFETFSHGPEWMKPGDFNTGELVRLMRSRRSVRSYKEKVVPEPVLRDLVRAGITAPSGSNCQDWSFTVIRGSEQTAGLGIMINAHFRKINSMAEKPWLRALMKLLGKPQLDFYYRNYYEINRHRVERCDREGTDWLFYSAPALIIISSGAGESTPLHDAMLATQNICLAAHSMGLGTCIIGFALSALNMNRKIKAAAKIPEQETVQSVITVGYPAIRYRTVTGRKEPVVRFVT